AEGIDLISGDGFLPATVPAAFGAWVTALLYYGRLGLKETLGPVVDLADEGFPLYPSLRAVIATHADRYREQWPTSAAIYLDDGKVPALGWRVRNPDLARTLKGAIDAEMREQPRGREAGLRAALDYFYRGEVAERASAYAATTEVRDVSGR